MQWSEAVNEYINQLKPVKVNDALKQRVVQLMDLTSLNMDDTENSIAVLCQKAKTSYGHVAAVCVMPSFVRLAASTFQSSPIKVATVANFPEGESTLEATMIEIGRSIQDGAQEVDVVFPYHRYLAGERHYVHDFIESCKAACGDNVTLKVILETSMLGDIPVIADACFDVIAAGADFVKTSTGKLAEGATLEAAATMLLVIKHVAEKAHRQIGFKAAGGIKTLDQAAQFIELADLILGRDKVTPAYFRLGASRLIDEIKIG